MPIIQAMDLTKHYRVHQREAGLGAAVRSLWRRTYKTVDAVNAVSFALEPGEIVGFLGPNGAGKTTTLKMLSGLLYPTSGSAAVLGHTPWQRQESYLRQISLVMGQKSQLWFDVPAMDSYLIQKEIYEIDDATFRERLGLLSELLELDGLLKVQVRQLSLGERMKCELAGS
ncbi:MAG: ATP-binding cassette domain-containing protein, partial [Chloroflexi bacterium]|nr:ATP-binding cassette domain-containing protein [Chloroflexota bacterium]